MSGTPEETIAFEEAIKHLELIVRALEDGGTTLDEALGSYEKGVGLLKHCYGLLQQAEQKIQMLTGETADGKPLTAPFEHTATAAALKPESGRKRSPGAG